jgi:hypothetical protein
MEIDVEDLLNNNDLSEKALMERIHKDTLPTTPLKEDVVEADDGSASIGHSKDISELCGRLKMWYENCRDLLVDLRTVNYEATDDDTYIEFRDKSYYGQKLYFKIDPQKPKDVKVVHATKQLCKIIGIPYAFFSDCRPSLKKNVLKTWQSGLADDVKKAQNVFKIRESKSCTIIRAITSTTKSIIPLYELIQIIKDTLTVPFKMDCVYGDEKDDLMLHTRFLFEKEYDFNGPVCLGFSITASELDACPLSIDVLLYNKIQKTYCVALYGGESFFKSDYKGLQSSSLKDILPLMLVRLGDEIPEILLRLDKKQQSFRNSVFCAESEAMDICKAKGLTSKIKKAIYHQVSECIDSILTPWDLAIHVGLVAKDFDALKRLQIEKAIGIYLNLFFSEGGTTDDDRE